MSDAHKLLFTRGVRGLADGVVSIVLATYLTGLGFGPVEVGAHRHRHAARLGGGHAGGRPASATACSRRRILLGAAALMVLTGLGFAGVTAFWPLMVVAVVGTLNPSSGDVSVFLPTEQAALAAHGRRGGPDDGLRLRTTWRVARRRGGGAGERRCPPSRRPRGVLAAARRARRLRLLRRLRRRSRPHLPAALARAGGPPRAARRAPPLAESRADRARAWRRCSASIRSAAASSCSRCWCSGSTGASQLDPRTTAGACSSSPAR